MVCTAMLNANVTGDKVVASAVPSRSTPTIRVVRRIRCRVLERAVGLVCMLITVVSLGEDGQDLRERVRERPKVKSRTPNAMSRTPAPRSAPSQGLAPVKGR